MYFSVVNPCSHHFKKEDWKFPTSMMVIDNYHHSYNSWEAHLLCFAACGKILFHHVCNANKGMFEWWMYLSWLIGNLQPSFLKWWALHSLSTKYCIMLSYKTWWNTQRFWEIRKTYRQFYKRKLWCHLLSKQKHSLSWQQLD